MRRCVAFGASPAAAQKITFTLNWVAGGDHAPYFYAQKMGWYKHAGLDVDFETGRGSAASAQKVGAGALPAWPVRHGGRAAVSGQGRRCRGRDERLCQLAAGTCIGSRVLASQSAKDLAGKKIGNPAGDGARTMWPALAKTIGIDPNSVTWVNIDANSKLSALKSKTVDATTSFFNLHHVFARELGNDMGFLAWKDAGVNPYGNSIIANGAWLKANHDKADKFVKITQKAFAECAKTPDPCIKALVEANGALLYQNELDNWHLVTILMNDETSRTVALGWQDDKRMADDYKLVDEYLKMEKPYDVKSGLHQRVPRQEREDAADQSAEALLIAWYSALVTVPGRPRMGCSVLAAPRQGHAIHRLLPEFRPDHGAGPRRVVEARRRSVQHARERPHRRRSRALRESRAPRSCRRRDR